jgi:predicted N-formylglutamate amidohydrolase
VHSFTPLFAGKVRTTDLGLLYDPQRASESRFITHWRKELEQHSTNELTIHRNRPYRGTSDGFTTSLRKQYSNECYLGIELELSQKWLSPKQLFPKWLQDRVIKSLNATIQNW